MTKLSEHFSLSEFTRSATADKLGIVNDPTIEHLQNLKILASKLEEVRELLGSVPIIISSGYRNPQLNKAVDGSTTSDHPKGLAADFSAPRFGTIKEVCEAIAHSDIKFDQLIYEQGSRSTWVHLGVGARMRGQVLSWSGRAGYVTGIKDLPR